MSLRLKLFLLLAATASLATLASLSAFTRVQRRSLLAAESAKDAVLLGSVRAMTVEAQLAMDPLMLVDYLNFLARNRSEVVGFRIKWDGRLRGSSGTEELDARTETIAVPAYGRAPTVTVELLLSRAVPRERQDRAERALARDFTRFACAGVALSLLLSFPIAWTITSRVVGLRRALQEIGEGRFEGLIDERGGDEIAGLARGVNAMVARLNELDELKRRFVSSVTHELRAPLFAIESYARMMLAGGTLSLEDRARIVRVEENAARLARFVSSLLNAARIQRGELDYVPGPCALDKLVEDVVLFYGPHATEREKKVVIEIGPGSHATRADGELLNLALTNLLTNAIKYAPMRGTVVVGLRRLAAEHEISVKDDGSGMALEEQARLFRPFERASTSRGLPGTGLGLSIVKGIAEKHGGRVGLESAPGKGTRFFFTVPFPPITIA